LKNKINSFNPLELKKSVDEIKTTINSIFNNLDIDNKKEIDLKSTISIYNYIRDELDNYELVRKQIVEKEFNNLTKISQEELDVFIKNPTSNQEKIKKIL
jgi:BMFP domain-containing protein YqiC